MSELFWFEKYRPRSFDEVVDLEEVKSRLREFVKSGNMPHLLFYGPPGTGKTTMALVLARELYGEYWRENTLELNASDERGINVIRERVKEFARTAPVGKAPFKLVILDEADNMTSDAQQALRRIMEIYAQNTRFILLANYISGIIEPIQSRVVMIRFNPLPKEAVISRLRYIAENEGVKISDDALETIYEFTQGDMRKAINALQIAAATEKEITEDVVARALGMVSPRLLRETLQEALKGNFSKAMTQIYGFVVDGGVGELEIIRQIHREVLRLDVPEYVKPELAYIIAEAHYATLRGARGLTQIFGALAKIRRLLKQAV
ncbi:replication factor C small subunit [Pyrobaculum islandicum DSM 4184]|uniref:Replication factor C small subunit 2 n=1 Tax=Pyrobaculum islandicum (strain DSM 4184 / JCM 9189 / GEO3) TaxID=384616 RepID=RFCS2_PYRIL|nr:replication factor C small subunit [Pyrobaculum islandicum]A1RV38.1 RecName: Full=Replication factor C small subunit 2; Short=RFC small subunit 2; AltName: Full=Clamp loader small subunit 2 [Pyrobaculum islandicum DSM 4184]ABL88820.1 replication factor C small subunit [Pyrobaculum islandicum DSM 4184]